MRGGILKQVRGGTQTGEGVRGKLLLKMFV